MKRADAVIVAAGRGSRAAAHTSLPKQYAALAGRPVLSRTLDAFLTHPQIRRIVLIIHPDDAALWADAVRRCTADPSDVRAKLLEPTIGGATRQASVLAGLEALSSTAVTRPDDGDTPVLIHDAARAFVTADLISRVIAAVQPGTGAIAAIPLSDTLKRVDDDSTISQTIPRGGLWRAQTPQGFVLQDIRDAHRAAAASGRSDFTDDAAIAEDRGLAVRVVEGDAGNTKLTTADDFHAAETVLSGATMETRIGTGFDVHKFGPGKSLWLCGVEIAHDMALVGHSDADVGLHALTDALLGAIGDGDIGTHFPPSDPKWKGAASGQFLADAARRVRALGGRIINVDVTLLCEVPKIGPHRDAMRQRLAEILEIDIARTGVKATTTEGLGFTGRREGIAAMAGATVTVPRTS